MDGQIITILGISYLVKQKCANLDKSGSTYPVSIGKVGVGHMRAEFHRIFRLGAESGGFYCRNTP
jgi:hypothetical protein